MDKRIRIMQVAVIIQKRYQKARDLMLSGTFGPVTEDEDGKLVVSEAAVHAWQKEQATPAPDATKPSTKRAKKV